MGYSGTCRVKCIGKCILNFANQNIWCKEREPLDSGGGGALSQGAGHDGKLYSRAKTSRFQFTKKPYLPLFSSETADKFARGYAVKKSFRHALHLVTVQNQVAHAPSTRGSLVSEIKYTFPNTFCTARARVSRNLK